MAFRTDNLQCDPGSLTDAELTAALLDTDRARSTAEAVELGLLGEFDARQLHTVDGEVNAATWLAHRGDVTSGTARRMRTDARNLRRHPASARACGTVGTARVCEFLRRVNDRTEAEYVDTEDDLLGHMATLTVDEVIRLAIAWARMVDTDGPEPKDTALPSLKMGRSGDGLFGSFAFFGEHGAFFENLVRRTTDRILRSEPAGEHLPNDQRNALALLDNLAIADGADPATADPSKATVIVHVPIEFITGGGLFGGVCTLDPFDTPISAETARRLMCDAKVHRFITGPDGVPIDLGRSERTVKGHQRLAVILRDRCCTFPGCDQPPAACNVHHIEFWVEHDGPSDMINLTLMCRRHHVMLHEGHYTCQRRDDGGLEFHRPNGTPLHHPIRAGP